MDESTPLAECESSLRLVLYSDQVIAANRKLDLEVLRMLGRSAPRIGYLSSAPDPARRFFDQKKAYYAQYGTIDLIYFEPELLETRTAQEALLACDAIHLTGGDTRGYLARLKRAGLIAPLRQYALSGKLLIGTSAGAILMTPSIAVNGLFEGEMPIDSLDQAALDLVPFEVFPHLQADPTYRPSLIQYSRKNGGRPIFACPDGDGIVVEHGIARALGAIVKICAGVAG
jgi:dipeptidase E